MVQDLCKTCSHPEQGSHTLPPPPPKSATLPARWATRNVQASQVLYRPQKKKTPLQPWLRNYKYLPRTCALQFTNGPRAQPRPLRLRRPATPPDTGQEKRIPWFHKEKVWSKEVARSSFLTSWCFMTPIHSCCCSCCRCCLTARNAAQVPHALATAARDYSGSAYAPPLPAARASQPVSAQGAHLRHRPAELIWARTSRSRHRTVQSACGTHCEEKRVQDRGGRKKRLDYPPIKRGLGAARPFPRPLVALLWKPREATVTTRRGRSKKLSDRKGNIHMARGAERWILRWAALGVLGSNGRGLEAGGVRWGTWMGGRVCGLDSNEGVLYVMNRKEEKGKWMAKSTLGLSNLQPEGVFTALFNASLCPTLLCPIGKGPTFVSTCAVQYGHHWPHVHMWSMSPWNVAGPIWDVLYKWKAHTNFGDYEKEDVKKNLINNLLCWFHIEMKIFWIYWIKIYY